MRQNITKLLMAIVVLVGTFNVATAQTIMYHTDFEGGAGPAPLTGPDPVIVREANSLNVQVNGVQPNSPSNALSQFSFKNGMDNYMKFYATSPAISVTAGKWYLIEVYVSDNGTAADFNVSSISTDPSSGGWDIFDTDGSRIKHLRTTQIEPDAYNKWEVAWYCTTSETRWFAIHEDLQVTGNDPSEAFLDDFKITEWDCAITTYGPGGEPTGNYDVGNTASTLDFCDAGTHKEMIYYGSTRKDMGFRGEVVLTGDATDTWMDVAVADCWSSAGGWGGDYVAMYEIPPTTDSVFIAIDSFITSTGATGGSDQFNIFVSTADCASPTSLYCAQGLTTAFITLNPGDVSGGAYIFIADATLFDGTGWEDYGFSPRYGSEDLFDICVSNSSATCALPLQSVDLCIAAGDAVAVYAPDDGGGNVACDELSGVGGSPDGAGMMYTTDGATTDVGSSDAISSYAIVTADNFSCTTTDITLTNAGANWTDLDNATIVSGESLPTGASPIEIEYPEDSLGRKTLTSDVAYCDFLFMQVNQVPPGAILGSDDVCPDTFQFTSTDAGTPGYTYQWFVSDPAGGTSEIFTDTLSSTLIAFENSSSDTVRFVVKLLITSECCGPLDTVYFNTDVFPRPAVPGVITPDSTCVGGWDTLSVSPNLSGDGYSYNWYGPDNSDVIETNSGDLYVDSALFGCHYYKVEAVDFNGCVSAGKDSVEQCGIYYAPIVDTIFPCVAGCNPICVENPITGATYRWYSDVALGAANLEQEGVSTCYSLCADTTTLTGAVWVTVEDVAAGCNETTPGERGDAIVTGSYTTLNFYDFTGDGDWFNGRNWSDRAPGALLGDGSDTAYCIPSCGTNAIIRAPCTIATTSSYDNDQPASCNDITLFATLTFGDPLARLNICGNATLIRDVYMDDNFDHTGTNGYGIIAFVGYAGPQRFINTIAANKFNIVSVNNTSATPLVYFFADAHQNMTIRDDGELWLINGVLTPDPSPYSAGTLDPNELKVVVENTDPGAVRFHSAASYVDGTLDRFISSGGGLYEFPVGNDVSYQRADLSLSGLSGMNDLNVRFDLANADLGRAVEDTAGLGALQQLIFGTTTPNMYILDNGANDGTDNGIWTAMPDAGTATYNIDLYGRYYAKSDVVWLTAVKRDANFSGAYPTLTPSPVGDWTIESSTDNPTAGVAGTLAIGSRNGYSGFSQFAIAVSPALPLAVDMLYFNGHAKNEMVFLDWKVENERNTDHYVVQRSTSGKPNAADWEDVGDVISKGAVKSNVEYEFVDEHPYSGTSFYRLLAVTKSGERTPSRVVRVNFSKDYLFGVYPNPATDNIDLQIVANKKGSAKVLIYNSLGALVENRPIYINEGNSNVTFNLNGYSKGVYHMKIKTDNELENITFVVD